MAGAQRVNGYEQDFIDHGRNSFWPGNDSNCGVTVDEATT